MMYRLLAVFAVLVAPLVSGDTVKVVQTGNGATSSIATNLRGMSDNEMTPADDMHRQLWGWDWGNLMFHLGLCAPLENCKQTHCGCPDCHLPHAHNLPFCHKSGGGGSSSSGSGSDSSSSAYGGEGDGQGDSYQYSDGGYDVGQYEGTNEDGEEQEYSAAGGDSTDYAETTNSQTPTRQTSFALYLVGAAAVAAVAGAAIYRKRIMETDAAKALVGEGSYAASLAASLAGAAGMMVPAMVVTRGSPNDFHELGPNDPAPPVSPKAYAI